MEKLQAMVRKEGIWIACGFEFDMGDGVIWCYGRKCGPDETVENFTRHFEEKGYSVIKWKNLGF